MWRRQMMSGLFVALPLRDANGLTARLERILTSNTNDVEGYLTRYPVDEQLRMHRYYATAHFPAVHDGGITALKGIERGLPCYRDAVELAIDLGQLPSEPIVELGYIASMRAKGCPEHLIECLFSGDWAKHFITISLKWAPRAHVRWLADVFLRDCAELQMLASPKNWDVQFNGEDFNEEECAVGHLYLTTAR